MFFILAIKIIDNYTLLIFYVFVSFVLNNKLYCCNVLNFIIRLEVRVYMLFFCLN